MRAAGVLGAVDRDAHDVGTGGVQRVDLFDGGVDVLRVRGGHALHGDRVSVADRGGADADFAGWVTGDVQSWGGSWFMKKN